MAISEPASSTNGWLTATASVAVSLPAGATTGRRMFFLASWKDFSVTATVSNAQESLDEVTEFADGSVASGNGTGSMKVGCWYRDHSGTEGNPTIGFSAGVIGGVMVIVFDKDASETWDTPTFVTQAITPAASPFSATSSSTITIADGALVMELIGIRDDSTTFTRDSNTALDDDGSPAVTWNGNVVEPTAHLSTTTGNDMACDIIYRLVTTGGAGVNLTATGTLSASETGAVLWVHQSVTAPAGERVPYYQPMKQLLAH